MKIIVKAKTNAKVAKVEKKNMNLLNLFNTQKYEGDLDFYVVSVKEKPVNGQANNAIIKALAEYFKTSPSSIHLLLGQTSKQKIFEIK